MTIDLSKAPEGATHYHPQTSTVSSHWFKPGYFCNQGFEECGWQDDQTPMRDRSGYVALQWTGEGLPPVGTVCEFQGDIAACSSDPWKKGLHDGVECSVIAHFKSKSFDLVAFTFVNPEGNTEVDQALPGALRPIRTAEQIAAEAYQKNLGELAEHIAGYLGFDDPRPSHVGVAEYLLDHGYTKQVTP